MNSKLIIFAILCFIVLNIKAQNNRDVLNTAIHEIDLKKVYNINQFSFIKYYIKGAQIIGLGEASHGTQEFYVTKSSLTKYLIKKSSYRTLAFEIDEVVATRINEYVQGNKADLSDILRHYGLYNSQELKNLFEWIKIYNSKQTKFKNRVSIIGFDNPTYWPAPFTRDSLMAKNLLNKIQNQKSIIWAHNSHLVKSNTWDITHSGIKAMGNFLSRNYGKKYYLLAFDTVEGKLNTVENGRLKEYEFKLSKNLLKSKFLNFFIDFRNLLTPMIYNLTYLSSSQMGNPQNIPSKLGEDIDALILIQKTTASKPIE